MLFCRKEFALRSTTILVCGINRGRNAPTLFGRAIMYKCLACLSVLLLVHGCVLADYAASSSPSLIPLWESSSSAGSTAESSAAYQPTQKMVAFGTGTSASTDVTMFSGSDASSSKYPDQSGLKYDASNESPEPGSMVLLCLVGLGGAAWRRRNGKSRCSA
jgi:hypothetical protein